MPRRDAVNAVCYPAEGVLLSREQGRTGQEGAPAAAAACASTSRGTGDLVVFFSFLFFCDGCWCGGGGYDGVEG